MTRYGIWLATIEDLHGCTPDMYGNMPCDNGVVCDRCYSKETEQAFQARIDANEDMKLQHQLYLACCSAVFGPVDPEFDGTVDEYYEIMYDAADQDTIDYLHNLQADMLEHRHDDK